MHFRLRCFLLMMGVLELFGVGGAGSVNAYWAWGLEKQSSFVLGQCCSAMACSASGLIDSVAGLHREMSLGREQHSPSKYSSMERAKRKHTLEKRVVVMSIYMRGLLRSTVLLLGFRSVVMGGLLPLINHVRPFWFMLGQWLGQVLFGSFEARFKMCDRIQAMTKIGNLSPSQSCSIRQEERRQMWRVFWSSAFSCVCLVASQMVE